jgi:hypothetical protein
MSLARREFFAILGAAAASGTEPLLCRGDEHQQHGAGGAVDFIGYRPRALSMAEYQLVDELAEMLLPADETGPGAHDAHVVYYIDVVLTHGPPERLARWKTGLAGTAAVDRYALLAEWAKNEMAPQNERDRFFVEFKKMVIDGFYASDLIQREHLGYRGNTAVSEFAGCMHAGFEHPDPV